MKRLVDFSRRKNFFPRCQIEQFGEIKKKKTTFTTQPFLINYAKMIFRGGKVLMEGRERNICFHWQSLMIFRSMIYLAATITKQSRTKGCGDLSEGLILTNTFMFPILFLSCHSSIELQS